MTKSTPKQDPDLDETDWSPGLFEWPRGYCGLKNPHMQHRFVIRDPEGPGVYVCYGRARVPHGTAIRVSPAAWQRYLEHEDCQRPDDECWF